MFSNWLFFDFFDFFNRKRYGELWSTIKTIQNGMFYRFFQNFFLFWHRFDENRQRWHESSILPSISLLFGVLWPIIAFIGNIWDGYRLHYPTASRANRLFCVKIISDTLDCYFYLIKIILTKTKRARVVNAIKVSRRGFILILVHFYTFNSIV